MSVLIKGMKMPQSCYMCDMQELSGAVGCKHAYDTNNSEWGRALNCPLIELPDHGDLIDRDALREKAHKLPNGYNHGYFHKCVDDLFDYAPVIIPVERSEDAAN